MQMVEDGETRQDEAGAADYQQNKKKTYVQTTFIPNESQQFVAPQKKLFNERNDDELKPKMNQKQ